MRRLAPLLAAVALALCAAPASARILAAQSVLPPGESGFVSLSGLLSGTGSPHLYDQQSLYASFTRRDDMLGHPGQREQPHAGVTIVRDSYGVPSVTGVSDADVWWGAGYAAAQDRLFQLEAFRRATTGHLAEILGKGSLAADIQARRDFYTPAELDAVLRAAPARVRRRYHAYLDGIDAWIAQVRADSSKEPGEFVATGDTPTPFSIEDLLAIGVYLGRTTPNGDGHDLDNARALDALGAARFNRLLPLRLPGQVSTVPRANGLFPSVPGRTLRDERAALRRSAAFVRRLPLPAGDQPSGSPGDVTAAGATPPAIGGQGSYAVVRSDLRHHGAFLLSDPELGFDAPSRFYEIEVHGPGLDARGATIVGVPIVAVGHDAHVAWAVTSGLSQTNALYAERLAGSERYVFRGRMRAMSCRDERFSYRTPPADVLRGKPQESGTVTERLCRTVHGPVQARAGGIAYARRYATWKRELATIVGLAELDRARTIGDVDRAMANVTWNENLIAADDRGHIGYWHPGLLPIRPRGWDERLPYPGGGQAEWRGFLAVSQRPHVIDPRQGWLTSWNDVPSQGWTTGNDPAPERVAGRWFRGAWLNRLVERNLVHRRASLAGLAAVIHGAATVAQQRPLATRELRAALHGAHGHAAAVLHAILAWDGSYAKVDSHGTVAPGVAAWQELKDAAQELALRRLGPGAAAIGAGGPNSEHLFDVSFGQAYALRTLPPAGWRHAAATAFDALAHRFGSSDPRRWRAPRALAPQSALGAEQPPPLPFLDRGSWEQLVALGR